MSNMQHTNYVVAVFNYYDDLLESLHSRGLGGAELAFKVLVGQGVPKHRLKPRGRAPRGVTVTSFSSTLMCASKCIFWQLDLLLEIV